MKDYCEDCGGNGWGECTEREMEYLVCPYTPEGMVANANEAMPAMRDFERIELMNQLMEGYCMKCGARRRPCFC